MDDDATLTNPPATSASAPAPPAPDDGPEWSIESASASMDAPPDDTTLTPHPDFPSAPASRETSTRPTTAAPATPSAPRKESSTQARISQAVARQREAERRAADLERRAADLEQRLRSTAPSPSPTLSSTPQAEAAPTRAAAPATTTLDLPDPPQYVQFETDADFAAAQTRWRAEVQRVWTAREAALKADITGAVEARLHALDAEHTYRAQREAATTRIAAVTQTPEYQRTIAANREALAAIPVDPDNPFLQDLIFNAEHGAELLPALASDLEVARAVASLPIPSRPLADAVRSSSSLVPLMQYFATDAGRDEYLHLRTLPPGRLDRAIGRLEARLETADRGPASVVHPITSAVPPAKPPVGSPRVPAPTSADSPTGDLAEWIEAENRAARAERLRLAGVSPS